MAHPVKRNPIQSRNPMASQIRMQYRWFQAMRAAGAPPSFRHLRPLCNYPEERFAAWFEKIVASTAATAALASSSSSPALALTPPRPPRGRRLGGVGGTPQPSVSATSLAELGISYIAGVRIHRVSSRRASSPLAKAAEPAAAPTVATTIKTKQDVEQREAFFAPGRADAKALVRKLSPGLDVLDLCCGTGGFALNAAAGKARSVLGVRMGAGRGTGVVVVSVLLCPQCSSLFT